MRLNWIATRSINVFVWLCGRVDPTFTFTRHAYDLAECNLVMVSKISAMRSQISLSMTSSASGFANASGVKHRVQ